jgi:hypothetical protein
MKKMTFPERLWLALPHERPTLQPYVEKATAFRNECGCTMGGIFIVTMFVCLIMDRLYFHEISGAGWITTLLRGIALVFGASILGKLIGIAIARLRLAWVHRELRLRYPTERG